jgi:8-oxo-dGTP diphosphatase
MQPDPVYLGTFTAPAANEQDSHVEAAIYRVHLIGEIRPASEIEEILWLDPRESSDVELASLTRDTVLHLATSAHGSYVENASQ